MIITIILILIGIFIFVVANSGKKTDIKKQDTFSPTTSELLLRTEIRIQESKKLLEDIRNKYPKVTQNFENENEYEVTGVHITNRKKYIIENCTEYDEVVVFHEKKNKYSDKAVAVKHLDKIIGYISESENEEVIEIIQKKYEAKITDIDYDSSYLSVKIVIEY